MLLLFFFMLVFPFRSTSAMKPLEENLAKQVNWRQYVYLNNCIADLMAQMYRKLYHPLENYFYVIDLFIGTWEHFCNASAKHSCLLPCILEIGFWFTNLVLLAQFNTFTLTWLTLLTWKLHYEYCLPYNKLSVMLLGCFK